MNTSQDINIEKQKVTSTLVKKQDLKNLRRGILRDCTLVEPSTDNITQFQVNIGIDIWRKAAYHLFGN